MPERPPLESRAWVSGEPQSANGVGCGTVAQFLPVTGLVARNGIGHHRFHRCDLKRSPALACA
jgi:hypothetical protein